MKALYNSETQVISDVHVSGTPVAGQNQTVIDFPDQYINEDLSHLTYDGTTVVEKTQSEIAQIDAIKNFNTQKMGLGLNSILAQLSNFDLRLEFGAMQAFAGARDFANMKTYMNLLISKTIMTQADFDLVNGVMQAQGIDLANF